MSSQLYSPPPWYTFFPDGDLNPGAFPDRLVNHPVIKERGMVIGCTIKPGVVFSTLSLTPGEPTYVVKILNPESEEIPLYRRLLRELHWPNNHTLPSEITRNGHPLLITPLIHPVDALYYTDAHHHIWSPARLMDVMVQLIEGIEYLHSLHIAHLDLYPLNLLAGTPYDAATREGILPDRLYIIDFDTSRQFTLGPGVQRAITLPPTFHAPPDGLKHFDPYSWDVHCVGRTLDYIVNKLVYRDKNERPHWIAQRYIQWLISDERGCTGVCRCRPTARTALRVLCVLRWIVYVMEGGRWAFEAVLRLVWWRRRA